MLVTGYNDVVSYGAAGNTIRYHLSILKCKTLKVFMVSEPVISPQRRVQGKTQSPDSSAHARMLTPVSLLD